MMALSKMMGSNRTLLELEIGWNALHEKGVKCLADALAHNSAMRRLGLSWNGCSFVSAFCRLIEDNKALTSLDISNNNTCKGASDAALRTSCHVAVLQFRAILWLWIQRALLTLRSTRRVIRVGQRFGGQSIHAFPRAGIPRYGRCPTNSPMCHWQEILIEWTAASSLGLRKRPPCSSQRITQSTQNA